MRKWFCIVLTHFTLISMVVKSQFQLLMCINNCELLKVSPLEKLVSLVSFYCILNIFIHFSCFWFVSFIWLYSPLFVTWEIETEGRIDLRGCIGTLSPTKLLNLKDFTFKSALKDRRFDPIHPRELHRLHCSVSLLVDYEDADHYEDWEVSSKSLPACVFDRFFF